MAETIQGAWWPPSIEVAGERGEMDEERDELYKTLYMSQNLNLSLSHLKVLIQIVSIILIVLLNMREKEKPPDLIATIIVDVDMLPSQGRKHEQ